jgi:hypothetical protein
VPLARGPGRDRGRDLIQAARAEALATAFCIATDATGVLVQLERSQQTRQPCRRGHYLVQIADRDHVFFEYLARETSAAVGELFKGFKGYVQADAKSVYDALFRPPDGDGESTGPPPTEVGCWSHYLEPAVIWTSVDSLSARACDHSR